MVRSYGIRVEYAHERKIRERNKGYYRVAHWPIWIWVFFLAPGPLTFDLFAHGGNRWHLLWLGAVMVGTGIAGWYGQLPGVEPWPYILRFSEDKPNPLYRRICYTFAWNALLNFAGLNLAGLVVASATGRWQLKQIYNDFYFPLLGVVLALGALGLLPRAGRSTEGEGIERRYFYGAVWSVTSAQTVLLLLWKLLPRTHVTDLIKTGAFVAVLAIAGVLSAGGILPRTSADTAGRIDSGRLILVLAFCFCGIALIALAGFVYQRVGLWRDRRRFKPAARPLPVSGRQLHFDCRGTGAPGVVLESGLAATSLSWALVQREVASITRVCSYDRAGLGWSDGGGGKLSLQTIVDDLDAVIRANFASGPVILVAHSFGGLLARAYACWRPAMVAGMVLVDPVSIEHWAGCGESERRRLRLGAKLSRRGAWLAELGMVRLCLDVLAAGHTRLPKLVARATAAQGSGLVNRLTGEMRRLPQNCGRK